MKNNTTLRIISLQVIPITACLLVVIFLIAQSITGQSLSTEITLRLEEGVRQAADSIEARHRSLAQTVNTIASNDLIVNSLIDVQGRDNYIQPFFKSLKLPGLPSATLSLLDYKGRLIATNGDGAPSDISWVPTVMQGSSHVSTSSSGLHIVFPVIYQGNPEGMILLSLTPERTSEFYEPALKTGYFSVLDSNRTPLYSSHPLEDLSLARKGDSTESYWLHSETPLRLGEQITIRHLVPRHMALANKYFQDQALLIMLGVCLAAVIAALFLTSRVVTSPLQTFLNHLQNDTPALRRAQACLAVQRWIAGVLVSVHQ